jgi:hypothetical protein
MFSVVTTDSLDVGLKLGGAFSVASVLGGAFFLPAMKGKKFKPYIMKSFAIFKFP